MKDRKFQNLSYLKIFNSSFSDSYNNITNNSNINNNNSQLLMLSLFPNLSKLSISCSSNFEIKQMESLSQNIKEL